MIKKSSRLQFKDLKETKRRLATRELSEAQLKHVTGGDGSGTTCDCDTCGCDDIIVIEV